MKELDAKDLLLNEALPISAVKKYVKIFNTARYNDWFKGEYRIYLKPGENKPMTGTVKPDERVEAKLRSLGYAIEDYLAGFAKKADGSSKNVQKIGGILAKNKADAELRLFQMDPARGSQKPKEGEYLVVISRHPYDIAGMSAGRSWSSCMNIGFIDPASKKAEEYSYRGTDLEKLRQQGKKYMAVSSGCNARYVENDVRHGSLVAYWIKNDDKNIQHPLARLLIKPYFNQNGESMLVCDNQYYPKEGARIPGFQETIEKWLVSVQGHAHGTFKQNNDLYNDHMPDRFERANPATNHPNFELKDGLTWEIVQQRYIWIALCVVSKAVIGLNRKQEIVWYSGDFKDGVWKSGDFMSGNFMKGNWISGDFHGGTFDRNATWIDGTFHGGQFNGKWMRGEFKGGAFTGRWYSGEFQGGTFMGNEWRGGTFWGGKWDANCDFQNGTWKGGAWIRGNFGGRGSQQAIWEGGDFDNPSGRFTGIWKGGTFKQGNMNSSIFERGNITGGTFSTVEIQSGNIHNCRDMQSCNIHNATIFNGNFRNCTIRGGVVRNGKFMVCEMAGPVMWYNGVWQGGTWSQATWKNGTWLMGRWESGKWLGGRWVAGENPPREAQAKVLDIERIKKIVKKTPYTHLTGKA